MRLGWTNSVCAVCLMVSGIGACGPAEAPPTLYQDLGTEDRPLLPTGGAWTDPAIAKGTAEWHPYRKPGAITAVPSGDSNTTATPGGGALDGELRGLLKEFNDLLAVGKPDEAVDFLIQEQLEPGKKLVGILRKFSENMDALAAASGDKGANFKRLAGLMSPATALKLEVETIQPRGDREAVGELPGAPAGVQLRFVLVKEEDGDVWYIDHPGVQMAVATLPMLEQSLPQFDTILASIKSGQITGDALATQLAALDEMLGKTMPGGQPPADGEK